MDFCIVFRFFSLLPFSLFPFSIISSSLLLYLSLYPKFLKKKTYMDMDILSQILHRWNAKLWEKVPHSSHITSINVNATLYIWCGWFRWPKSIRAFFHSHSSCDFEGFIRVYTEFIRVFQLTGCAVKFQFLVLFY